MFSAYGSNRFWVPETDGDLRITRFILLSDDAGLDVVESIPEVTRRRFSIGDYGPIPYWINDELLSVAGDAYPDQVWDTSQGAPGAWSVIDDIRRLLDDARSGRFKLILQANEADRLEGAFPDLFRNDPVHSKYWVSRYRLAITQARMETQPPHAIDDRLLSLGREWIGQFGTKTDYPRIKALLGKPEEGIYSAREIGNILYVYIVDRINRGKIPEIVRWVLQDREFIRIFPGGIYRFFIDNGWPNAPFQYERPKDLLETLRTAIQNADVGLLDALRGLAYVYFGAEEAPLEFNRFLLPIRGGYIERLIDAQSIVRKRDRGSPIKDVEYLNACLRLVQSWDALRWLDGIEYFEGRLRNLRKPIRSIDASYIDQLRPLAAEAIERALKEADKHAEAEKRMTIRLTKFENEFGDDDDSF